MSTRTTGMSASPRSPAALPRATFRLGACGSGPNVGVVREEGTIMKICRYEDCPDSATTLHPDATGFCPRCGETLSPATDEEVAYANRPKLPEDFVRVAEPVGAAQLAVAKSLLESAEVEFFTTNETTQDFLGFGQIVTGFNYVTGPVGIWVHKDDAESVAELLAGLAPDQPEAPEAPNEEPATPA